MLLVKANKVQPSQDQDINKGNHVEEEQLVASKVEKFLDQCQDVKKDIFIFRGNLSSFTRRCGGMVRR